MSISTFEPVTRAQYSVLRLIKQGQSLPVIAEELGLSFYTVRNHARNLQDSGIVQGNGRGRPMSTNVDLRRVRPRS
jgi:predicted ArsR family transcriptional regulator